MLGQTLQQLMLSYSDGPRGVVWHMFLSDARLFDKEFTVEDAASVVEDARSPAAGAPPRPEGVASPGGHPPVTWRRTRPSSRVS